MPKKPHAFLLAILAFGGLLIVACQQDDAGATQEPAPDDVIYTSFEDGELGLALEMPEGWITHSAFSGLTVASSQRVIDSDSLANIGDDAFVNIIPGELAVFGMQAGETFSSDRPGEVLAVYRALLENEGQSFTVRQPAETRTVNGQNVAQMTVESVVDGGRLVTILAVIIHDEFMAIVSAGSLQDRFEDVQPTLMHVLNSIVVSPPTGISQ